MKQKLSLVAITLILVLPIMFYAVFKAPQNSGALEAAAGKPMVIEFSSPMCAECQRLKKVLEVVEPQYKRKITFQNINAAMMDSDTAEKIKKYNVKVVPTTVFISKEGKVLDKKEGTISKEVFVSKLEELLK